MEMGVVDVEKGNSDSSRRDWDLTRHLLTGRGRINWISREGGAW